jgi:hypothetical protein
MHRVIDRPPSPTFGSFEAGSLDDPSLCAQADRIRADVANVQVEFTLRSSQLSGVSRFDGGGGHRNLGGTSERSMG